MSICSHSLFDFAYLVTFNQLTKNIKYQQHTLEANVTLQQFLASGLFLETQRKICGIKLSPYDESTLLQVIDSVLVDPCVHYCDAVFLRANDEAESVLRLFQN